MKTIGILATIAALLVTTSIADARTHYRHGYGNGNGAYPHYDRAGGPSYGGM
jgi:hypothetical protein